MTLNSPIATTKEPPKNTTYKIAESIFFISLDISLLRTIQRFQHYSGSQRGTIEPLLTSHHHAIHHSRRSAR